jgi:hypothetical protein
MDTYQVVDIVVKMVAAVVGAFWVLLNYVRGRTHRPRLRLRVAADRVLRDGLEYLIVKIELENVGLARVSIKHKGSIVTIYADQTPRGVEFAWGSGWKELGNFDLLKDQQWVEPSGLLTDQLLIALPGLSDRFIRVWAHARTEKVAWNASVVVGSSAPAGPPPLK